jgi:hypothetical protein
MIQDSRKSIYILDNGVPVLAKQTDVLLNRPVEYKAQIELFHRLFFTLAPDDAYIKENIQKSFTSLMTVKKRIHQPQRKRILQPDCGFEFNGEHPYGFHFTEYGAKEVLLFRKADDYQKISSHHRNSLPKAFLRTSSEVPTILTVFSLRTGESLITKNSRTKPKIPIKNDCLT